MPLLSELSVQLEKGIKLCDRALGEDVPDTELEATPLQVHRRKLVFPTGRQVDTEAILRLHQVYTEESSAKNRLEAWVDRQINDPNVPMPKDDLAGSTALKQLQLGPGLNKSDYRIIGKGLTSKLTHDVDRYLTSAGLVSGAPTQPDDDLPKFYQDTLEAFFARWGTPNLLELYILTSALHLPKSRIATYFQRKLEITADTRSARQLLNNKTLLAQSDKDGKLDDAILQAVEKELGQVRGEDSIEGVD